MNILEDSQQMSQIVLLLQYIFNNISLYFNKHYLNINILFHASIGNQYDINQHSVTLLHTSEPLLKVLHT